MNTIIAADIGGTQIRVAVYPEDGHIPLQQKRIPTYGEGTSVERLIGLIRELWPDEGQVLAISVGAPGQVDPQAGVILAAPNIAEWRNLPLRDELQAVFHVPVFLNNDANLAALGEWKYGAARGYHNVIYITISTGIGGGVILNDQLLLGQRGLATEIGHVVILPDGPLCGCGQRGHLEALSSGTGIANYVYDQLTQGRASSLALDPRPTARDISSAAIAGDPLALEAFERAAFYMGVGLANYLHLFNPSLIVIGGGVASSGDIYWKPMRAAMEKHVLFPTYLEELSIVPAALGDDCGLLGALAVVHTQK